MREAAGKRRAAAATRSGAAITVLKPRPICRGVVAAAPRPTVPTAAAGKQRAGLERSSGAGRDRALPPLHACPHGCVHPCATRSQPHLLSPACTPGDRGKGEDREVAGCASRIPRGAGCRAPARRRTPVPGTGRNLFPVPRHLPDARTGAPGCGVTFVQHLLLCPPQTGRSNPGRHRPGHSAEDKDVSLRPSLPSAPGLPPCSSFPASVLSWAGGEGKHSFLQASQAVPEQWRPGLPASLEAPLQ